MCQQLQPGFVDSYVPYHHFRSKVQRLPMDSLRSSHTSLISSARSPHPYFLFRSSEVFCHQRSEQCSMLQRKVECVFGTMLL